VTARSYIVASVAALLAAVPATAFAVTYILYYHTFGDWAVVCYRGMVDGNKSCFIDGPPIQFNNDPYTSEVRIEPAGGAVQVTVSARSGTRTGTKVRISVDGRTVQEGASDQIDHMIIAGADAASLIETMRNGTILVVELPELKRKMALSLKEFDDAYAAFDENLDRYQAPVGAPAPAPGAGAAPDSAPPPGAAGN
jgi:invasion protein IalB